MTVRLNLKFVISMMKFKRDKCVWTFKWKMNQT